MPFVIWIRHALDRVVAHEQRPRDARDYDHIQLERRLVLHENVRLGCRGRSNVASNESEY
jgi:hypothetical protein